MYNWNTIITCHKTLLPTHEQMIVCETKSLLSTPHHHLLLWLLLSLLEKEIRFSRTSFKKEREKQNFKRRKSLLDLSDSSFDSPPPAVTISSPFGSYLEPYDDSFLTLFLMSLIMTMMISQITSVTSFQFLPLSLLSLTGYTQPFFSSGISEKRSSDEFITPLFNVRLDHFF